MLPNLLQGTPSKKRKIMTGGAMDVDHSRAESNIHGLRVQKKKESKRAKHFRQKVEKVLKGETPTGKYTHTSTLYLPVANDNYYTVTDRDMGDFTSVTGDSGSFLEFFTPEMFKDAEGILFNNKTPSYNSWNTTAVNDPIVSGTNLSSANVTKVNGSSATFHFKNHSQHQVTLQMYQFWGKGGGTQPRTDIQEAFINNGQFKAYNPAGADSMVEYFRILGTGLDNIPEIQTMWKIKRVDWEFEPGEEAWYIMKGPHGYKMDGAAKNTKSPTTPPDGTSLTNPLWLDPATPGNGCAVVFRVASDITLMSSSTGSYGIVPGTLGGTIGTSQRFSIGRFKNATVGGGTLTMGGLCCTIQRHYNIELPEGLVPAKPFNATIVYNGYGLPGGTLNETSIDADQPAPTTEPE